MGKERQLDLFDSYATDPEEEQEPGTIVIHCEACGASDEYPDDGTVYACTICKQPLRLA